MAEQGNGASSLSGVLRSALSMPGSAAESAQAQAPAVSLPLPPAQVADGNGGAGAVSSPAAVGLAPQALVATWEELRALQEQVSDDLAAREQGQQLSEADRREMARSLVAKRVAAWSIRASRTREAFTEADEEAVRQAVFDGLFESGPLERYLRDESVENVIVDGEYVWVEYADKPAERVQPVASTNEELVALINRLARRSGNRERQLSSSTPMTYFRMPDGSRVATTELTTRPFVAIRRHRVIDYTLEDLVRVGTLSPCLRAFLHACVRSRQTLLIAGAMGSGKTTLLRTLGRLVPPGERIVTLESDRELYLDQDPAGGGAHVLAMEERYSNSEGSGGVSVADMLPFTLRMSASRVIVGEVRDSEAVPMLQAMSSGGRGSMCTIHADYPSLVLPRLTQLCRPGGMDREAVHELASTALNYVVFIEAVDETLLGGRRHRFVSHVLEVTPGEDGRVALDPVFAPAGEEDPRAVPQRVPSPESMARLQRAGLKREWLTVAEHGRWPQPLNLVGA